MVSGQPTGVTVAFNPASVTGEAATLTAMVAANAPASRSTVTISGSAPGLSITPITPGLLIPTVETASTVTLLTGLTSKTIILGQSGRLTIT